MKRVFGWILDKLNLKIDNNQKWILSSLVIVGLLHTYISPTLTKEVISNLPAQWIAFEALVSSLSGLFIGILWQGKLRLKAIRTFLYLIISESMAGFALALWLIIFGFNVWVFAIASLIYTNLVTIFVCKCIMAFKAKLWIEKDREIYDNNQSIVGGLTCVIGFGTALVFLPSLNIALLLWGLCCLIDDLGWGIVYWKNREVLKSIEDNE